MSYKGLANEETCYICNVFPHWRVPYLVWFNSLRPVYASVIIDSGSGLAPVQGWAIIWTIAGLWNLRNKLKWNLNPNTKYCVNGLVQDCSNSIANALELLQSCTKPSISMVSCQKGPTHHAYAWQIWPFWQDTLDMLSAKMAPFVVNQKTGAWLLRGYQVEIPERLYAPLFCARQGQLYCVCWINIMKTEQRVVCLCILGVSLTELHWGMGPIPWTVDGLLIVPWASS